MAAGSHAGGSFPRWRPDGKEIFFLDPESNLKAATITARGQALEIGAAQNRICSRRSSGAGRRSKRATSSD